MNSGLSQNKKEHYKELMRQDLEFVKEAAATGKDKPEAFERLNRLLSCDPEEPIYHYYMGTLLLHDKHYGAALPFFHEAIKHSNGQLPEAYNNCGICYRTLCRLDEANEMFLKASEIRPHATYYGNIASYYVSNATPDKAIEYCKKALELEPNDNSAKNNLACAYLEKGEYQKGWEIYQARFNVEDKNRKEYPGLKLWKGEKGVKVIVTGEQGIGDEIMFSSVLPDIIKDCNVILDCHDRLVSIFRNSFDNILIYGTKRVHNSDWVPHCDATHQVAIGTLARYYRNDKKDFPGTAYLKADPRYIGFCINQMLVDGIKDDDYKIGFSWKGGTPKTFTGNRYNDLENWVSIFKEHPDVKFISLQYHDDAKEILQAFCAKHDIHNIYHWDDIMADYDLTSGLVSCLDLIISVPQSVVHLSGALGVDVWQLTPYKSLWQMGPHGQDMPWYKSVKNIWMKEGQEWPDVMSVVRDKLCKRLVKNTAA